MPSVTVYNNALKEMAQGTIRFDGNTSYKLLLVAPGSTYTPNKSHTTKTNFTGNGGVEVSGTGYTAGGASVTFDVNSVSVSGSNSIDIAIPTTTWASSTISAKAAVLLTSTDKLVSYIDFGSTIASSNSNFTVTFSTALKLQN